MRSFRIAATMAHLSGLPRSRRPWTWAAKTGFTGCRSVGGHAEALSDLGTAADDGAIPGELAAVAVERSEGGGLVAVELVDFSESLSEVSQQGPGGDFAHPLNPLDDIGARFESGIRANKFIDGLIEQADLLRRLAGSASAEEAALLALFDSSTSSVFFGVILFESTSPFSTPLGFSLGVKTFAATGFRDFKEG